MQINLLELMSTLIPSIIAVVAIIVPAILTLQLKKLELLEKQQNTFLPHLPRPTLISVLVLSAFSPVSVTEQFKRQRAPTNWPLCAMKTALGGL